MALVSVRRLLVALAVCLIGTNEYGLVEGEGESAGLVTVKCKAKCTEKYSPPGQLFENDTGIPSMDDDEEDACYQGCDKMYFDVSVTDKDSCVSECSNVSTTRSPAASRPKTL